MNSWNCFCCIHSLRPQWNEYIKILNEQYKIIDNTIVIHKRISAYNQIKIPNFYQVKSFSDINKGNEFAVDYGQFCTTFKFHDSMNNQTILIEEYYGI